MNPTETGTIEPTIDEVVAAMSPEERAEFNEWCDSRARTDWEHVVEVGADL